MVKRLNSSTLDNTITKTLQFEKINIIGSLIDVPEEALKLIHNFITKNLFEIWGIPKNKFQYLPNQALLGAALFAINPTTHNERFARCTYAVTLKAVKTEPFEEEILDKVKQLEEDGATYSSIYNFEFENAYPTSEKVDLFCEDYTDQTGILKTIHTEEAYPFIFKGTRFSEKEHSNGGIRKRFFSTEECIVYAGE